MALTEIAVRNAKPTGKQLKLFDGRGMFMLVTPAGQKYWRLKFRFAGKEKLLPLGVYPEIGLKQARIRRDGTIERAANSFEAVAREWFTRQAPDWAASHADNIMCRLENDVFPWLGGRAIADLKAPELLRWRAVREERVLAEQLHSYTGYMARVRFRFVPFVW
ncbi:MULTISPECIES: tyrosine-type recombinase/integrase [Paraburkholderia]|uniref:DUF4102 domain-containing protein n=1 Tax=Paraburkholderia podalyriae TaxID=1938811 RepID=A0ABR7PFE7_9BURK|nr:DUF4102 domain-containing protein [Paraburkholderia podalyriae]